MHLLGLSFKEKIFSTPCNFRLKLICEPIIYPSPQLQQCRKSYILQVGIEYVSLSSAHEATNGLYTEGGCTTVSMGGAFLLSFCFKLVVTWNRTFFEKGPMPNQKAIEVLCVEEIFFDMITDQGIDIISLLPLHRWRFC